MTKVVGASLGLMVAGPLGAVIGALLAGLAVLVPRRRPTVHETRLVLVVLLVEMRSGVSILAALQAAADLLPHHPGLRKAARLATVSGLVSAIPAADGPLRPVLAQLARAQISGSSISGTLRSLLDQDLARERAERIARARSLPVRLMIPVTLLMLPGLVLILYAPSLLRLFEDLTGAWT